mmetsp:Transcript_1281/g.2655  ORF Transcript_1281/g.2655 Transcript_1281/m.2655 type:complete len:840 (+) Transcript_1281:436-2955(+)
MSRSDSSGTPWGVKCDLPGSISPRKLPPIDAPSYLIHVTWLPLIVLNSGIYIAMLWIFGYWAKERAVRYSSPEYVVFNLESGAVESWDNDLQFRQISLLLCTLFLASALRNTSSLFVCHGSHLRGQGPVTLCTVVLSLTAAHAHYVMHTGSLPVFNSCFGRKMHLVRFAEWLSSIVFLIGLMNSLDCLSWKEFYTSTAVLGLSIAFACASSLSCQLNWCSASSSGNLLGRLDMILILISCFLFADVYRVLLNRFKLRKEEWCKNSSRQAFKVVVLFASVWTVFVIIYFAGIFGLITSFQEEIFFSAADVLSKFLSANALSEAHLCISNNEHRYRTDLAIQEDANEAQRRFLRYVFHEVRSPLNTIRLGVESLKCESLKQTGLAEIAQIDILDEDDPADDGFEFVVACMDEAAVTMSDTLNDVLTYQKIEEGKLDFVFSPFHLHHILQHVAFGFQLAAQEQRVQLNVCVDHIIPSKVIGVPIRIRQVISNLVSNAIKAIPAGDNNNDGEVTISVRAVPSSDDDVRVPTVPLLGQHLVQEFSTVAQAKTSFEFSVSDNGIGISAEGELKMFQDFNELRSGSFHKKRGAGLGLSNCKHLVHKMDGSIGMRSELGVGSTFFFTIPLEVVSTDSDNTVFIEENSASGEEAVLTSISETITIQSCATSENPHEPLAIDYSPKQPKKSSTEGGQNADHGSEDIKSARVLVVDDVVSNRKLAARTMRQFGFSVDQAADGVEAVKAAASKHYALVLMDNVMPRMSGLDATIAIRQQPRDKRLILFGVTGNAMAEDVCEFKAAGCDEVLTKPVEVELLKRLLAFHGLATTTKRGGTSEDAAAKKQKRVH